MSLSIGDQQKTGPVARAIRAKIADRFGARVLELHNESHKHKSSQDPESHFKLVVVSPSFEGQGLVDRHRAVYAALAEELAGTVHALSIHAYTADEWTARGGVVAASPSCRGGSRAA